MAEINDAARMVAQLADPGARIIFGAYHDKNLRPNQVKVTLIATGFNGATRNSLFSNGDGRQTRHESSMRNDFSAPKADLYVTPRAERNFQPKPAVPSALAKKQEAEESAAVEIKPRIAQKKEERKENDAWYDVPAFLRRGRRRK